MKQSTYFFDQETRSFSIIIVYALFSIVGDLWLVKRSREFSIGTVLF